MGFKSMLSLETEVNKPLLDAYFRAKKIAPDTTSCCVLLRTGQASEILSRFGTGLVLQCTYRVGDEYPTSETCNQLATFPMWYDPPHIAMSCNAYPRAERLDVLFHGRVGHYDASVLFDSGATHCFIDKRFVDQHNLSIVPQKGIVACGGDFAEHHVHTNVMTTNGVAAVPLEI
jgi:hypothetical protein